jgi:hypothetical protein
MVSEVSVDQLYSSWIPLAGLLITLGAILCALVYAFGTLLFNDRMKAWTKSEIAELFYSVVLIVVGFSLIGVADRTLSTALGVSNNLGGSISGGGCLGTPTSAFIPTTDYSAASLSGRTYTCLDICSDAIGSHPNSVYHGINSCHVKLGIYYFRSLYDEAKATAYDIYVSYIWRSMVADFTINVETIFEASGFFTFNPFKGFLAMGNSIQSTLFDWAIKLMMLNKFQEVFLRFIATGLYPTFLVMGAILRAFSFTRRLGGLMVAIALSLFFVFPSFYAFGSLVMLGIKNQVRTGGPDLNPNNNPDPPIATSMYLSGNLLMPGGTQSADQFRGDLSALEGMTSDQYFNAVSGNSYFINGQQVDLRPRYDFGARPSNGAGSSVTEYTRAYTGAMSWFNQISRLGRIDSFISHVWSPNGYVESFSRLTFWSTFFSLLGILSTIAAIRSISTILGGDVEIAGLTRLI